MLMFWAVVVKWCMIDWYPVEACQVFNSLVFNSWVNVLKSDKVWIDEAK